MGKRVKISLVLDEEFVRLLWANVSLEGLGFHREPYRPHDPKAALAVAVVYEARGASEE